MIDPLEMMKTIEQLTKERDTYRNALEQVLVILMTGRDISQVSYIVNRVLLHSHGVDEPTTKQVTE